MKCLEAQRLMQLFLEKKLDAPELHAFVEHIENCPNCREELELNMAVYSTLLSGKQDDRYDYNFVERTNAYLRVAKRYLRRIRLRQITQGTIVMLAQLVLVLFILSAVQGKFIRDHGQGIISYLFSVNEETEQSSEMLSEAVTEDASETEDMTEGAGETLAEEETETESETMAEILTENAPARNNRESGGR